MFFEDLEGCVRERKTYQRIIKNDTEDRSKMVSKKQRKKATINLGSTNQAKSAHGAPKGQKRALGE